jgi:hypothetical protein
MKDLLKQFEINRRNSQAWCSKTHPFQDGKWGDNLKGKIKIKK